jgi:hypothetical protein
MDPVHLLTLENFKRFFATDGHGWTQRDTNARGATKKKERGQTPFFLKIPIGLCDWLPVRGREARVRLLFLLYYFYGFVDGLADFHFFFF